MLFFICKKLSEIDKSKYNIDDKILFPYKLYELNIIDMSNRSGERYGTNIVPLWKNFNTTIASAAVAILKNNGYEIKIHDLYREKI